MQVTLSVSLKEIDNDLLTIIKELLLKNIEIIIKRDGVKLEEYAPAIPLNQVLKEFSKVGYSEAFLQDLQRGLETSSVYRGKDEL